MNERMNERTSPPYRWPRVFVLVAVLAVLGAAGWLAWSLTHPG